MKVLLINPPFQRLKKIKKIFFPLGLGYLASSLVKNGFECKIYNVEVPKEAEILSEIIDNKSLLANHRNYVEAIRDGKHKVWQEVAETLRKFEPDLVGISVMTPIYGSALKISRLVKEYNKECKVVWGGPHPSVESGKLLLEEVVDFVIREEGEDTIVELCKSLNSGPHGDFTEIKGLSYKCNNDIVHNPARKLCNNIDKLEFPARSLLLQERLYPASAFGKLITSRGCPFECGYCSAYHIWGRHVRFRSIENVILEIKNVIERYKTREFYFFDDNFTLNRKYTSKLCEAMIDNKLDISWNCITRPDLIDNNLIKVMKKAGCCHVDIGIESGSPAILNRIDKKASLEQIRQASRILKANRMNWGAFLMIGFPDETERDIEMTMQFAKEISPISFEFSIFTPYPGTKLYALANELGLISEDFDWSRFSHQSPENHFTKNISKEKFSCYVNEFSTFVDSYNGSLRPLVRKAINRISFWRKQPDLFFKKAYSSILRKLKRKFYANRIMTQRP